MHVPVIGSCFLHLLLWARCFCDLSRTTSAFDCNKFTHFVRMTAGDMCRKVTLSSICSRNEWFLIARLMDTVLNPKMLKWIIRVAHPPESSSDRIQIETRQEQDSDTTLDQDFVAPAPCHMPTEVVSVRVREHQYWDRTYSGVVFGAERRELQQA